MNKYLFLFYDYESILCGWYSFDPREPVSDAMAVQQAFNILISDEKFRSVSIYQDSCHYESSDGRLLVCSIRK